MRWRPVAWLVGLAGTALVTMGSWLLDDWIDSNVTALLLLVPVGAASVVGGWRIGLRVAFLAAMTYAVVFLPPRAHVRVGLTRDILVLVVFVAVALAVGALVGRRDEGVAPSPSINSAGADNLLRAVSHDLRTPLSTIRAASSDLLTGAHGDEGRRAELLGLVVSESERLDRIVGNLLSASRVRAGALNPVMAPESLAAVFTRSVGRLERLGTPRIVVDLEPSLPDVLIDAVQIDQVVTNLLENAVRVSPPNEPIEITARRCDAGVEVVVSDRGPGFPPGNGNENFEAFRSTSGSSGLGLVVCKAVVEAHGGTIDVDGASAGARVRFTLLIA